MASAARPRETRGSKGHREKVRTARRRGDTVTLGSPLQAQPPSATPSAASTPGATPPATPETQSLQGGADPWAPARQAAEVGLQLLGDDAQ